MARRLLPSAGGRDADLEDLVSQGMIGLLAAADTFDSRRGLAFSTYAAARIRGAILDDRRKRDPVPRSVRLKQRRVKHAREKLREQLGREPSAAETATQLGLDVEQYFEVCDVLPAGESVSLNGSWGPALEEAPRMDALIGDDGTAAEDSIIREQEIAMLHERITRLSHNERTVLGLYYYEGLKLHEIATVLGVSESRISQIRSKAIRTLRQDMEGSAA